MPDRRAWGHLDLLEIVGRGWYGTVYRAWDPRLDRHVAFKLFHGARESRCGDPGRADAGAHPSRNVVTVYGADVFDGVAGIWMELVHGRTVEIIVEGQGPMRRGKRRRLASTLRARSPRCTARACCTATSKRRT